MQPKLHQTNGQSPYHCDLLSEKARWGQARWGQSISTKKLQKVPIKIALPLLLALFFSLFLNPGGRLGPLGPGPSRTKNNEKNKANGNGDANANFDSYFSKLFFQNGLAPSSLAPSSFFQMMSTSMWISTSTSEIEVPLVEYSITLTEHLLG